MPDGAWIHLLVLVLSVFIASAAQVLLKKEALRPHTSLAREYINHRVIISYALFLCTTLMNVYAFSRLPLSLGPVVESSGYIYAMVFGAVFFGEKITHRKCLATACIIAGVLLFTFYG